MYVPEIGKPPTLKLNHSSFFPLTDVRGSVISIDLVIQFLLKPIPASDQILSMRKNVLIFGHNDATQFIDIYNQYTRLFDPQKYEVTVAYLTGKPDQAVRERTLAENVIFLDTPKKQIRMLKIKPIRRMLEICREKNFEIVICHRYKPSYIMMWVARFVKIPALISVMHELGTMSSIGRRLLIAALGQDNMLFGGVSNAVRDDMRRKLWFIPKERVVTLYNVLDVEKTEPELYSRTDARAQLNLNPNDFVFGNIARLAPNKDQDTLLRAFAAIKPICPNVKLVIIGDGSLEEKLKALATTLNISDDVIFTGFMAGGHRYMPAFDCFVLSSIQEAFGRVLLEAMIAKLPIIATRVHGIPEVVGKTNILIDAGKMDILAAMMKQVYLASPTKREQTAHVGYQRVLDHFSIPAFKQFFWRLPVINTLRDATCA